MVSGARFLAGARPFFCIFGIAVSSGDPPWGLDRGTGLSG